MSVLQTMHEYVGDWVGSNRLWLAPDDPVRASEATATVALVASGGCLMITYTWAEDGKPQEGIILVRDTGSLSSSDIVWFDSWHTGGNFMVFRGEEQSSSLLSAIGSYSAPEGPDWGWRIVVDTSPAEGFEIRMDNITPDGASEPAVKSAFRRP